jgi:hypothetical protein
VPPTGITGAAFEGERLLVAGQDGGGPFQVWSIDLATGSRELEIEREIVGESEGLDVVDALGGRLHWLIQPYNEQSIPTYGVTNGTILNFAPALPGAPVEPPAPCAPPPDQQPAPGGGAPSPTDPPPSEPAPPGTSSGTGTPPQRIRLTVWPRRVAAGRTVRFRIRTTVVRNGKARAVPRASVHFAGRLFRTDSRGRAKLRARLRITGWRHARASHAGMRKGHARVWVRSAR